MQTATNFFNSNIVNRFAVHRDLHTDEFNYQQIKEGSKLIKRTLKLKQTALKNFEKQGQKGEAEVQKLNEQITELKTN